MTDTPRLLLNHHLKTLKLPTFLREYDKLARQCAGEGVDHVRYLQRLAELELIDRERRLVEQRIKAARFPVVKSLDGFDFKAIPSLNKTLVSSSPAANTSTAMRTSLPLATAAPARPMLLSDLDWPPVRRVSVSALPPPPPWCMTLMEARDDKQLLRFQKRLAGYKLLIIDELGFVPLSKTGAELLFEVFSQRYERGSILVTSNLPFDEWTEIFGSERLTGALLDRLTHHVVSVR